MRLKELLDDDLRYTRDYVLFMVKVVVEEYNAEVLPESFLKEFVFLALYQQMCCVSLDSIKIWMDKWDDLLKRYREYPALLEFIDRLESRFFEGP